MYNDLLEIAPEEFKCSIFRAWRDDWLLLTAGDFQTGSFNAMTVGWGMFGVLWGDPAVTVLVRPARHTLAFLEEFDTFTLTAFGAEYREALARIGSVSGRDVPDKIRKNGLTPVEAHLVEAPAFAEAELVMECRKTYCTRFSAKEFIDKNYINQAYPERDYHICFSGRVERIAGTEKYLDFENLMEK